MDKVSIIIVSYNTRDITERCLNSIQISNYKFQIEVIVVDNASTDGSVEMIKKRFPKVKLIATKTNLGFAKGNNLGMKEATGDYFLLLNSDAFLENDTLNKCLNYIGQCDVLGCKLTYENGKLQPSAGYLPNPLNTFIWVWGIDTWPIVKNIFPSVHPKQANWFVKNKTVGWVTGAFMFMKRDVYEKTQGFDEKYFMYGEEVDWCKRISDAHFLIKYIADFSIVHLQGASQANMSQALSREMQGLAYYFKKYYSWLPIHLIIKWGNLARVIACTIAGQTERVKVYKDVFRSL